MCEREKQEKGNRYVSGEDTYRRNLYAYIYIYCDFTLHKGKVDRKKDIKKVPAANTLRYPTFAGCFPLSHDV